MSDKLIVSDKPVLQQALIGHDSCECSLQSWHDGYIYIQEAWCFFLHFFF